MTIKALGAFPQGSIIDPFTGTDGTELPTYDGRWSTMTGVLNCQINTNRATGLAGTSVNTWNAQDYGPDMDLWADVGVKPVGTASISLLLKCLQTSDVATLDGLELIVQTDVGADLWAIFTLLNGVGTQVGTSETQEITAGDGIGLRIRGGTVQFMYRAGAGAWTKLGALKVTNLMPAAGRIGMAFDSATPAIDYIAAGTL